MFINHFGLIDVCLVDILVACVSIDTAFIGELFIYESTLVGQTRLLSYRVPKFRRITVQALVLNMPKRNLKVCTLAS